MKRIGFSFFFPIIIGELVSVLYLRQLILMRFLEFMELESIELPDQIVFQWNSFLKYCNENELLNGFFDKLLTVYVDEVTNYQDYPSLRQKFLLSWILYFLKANIKNGNSNMRRGFSTRKKGIT
jgi:hypothetical protein